MSVCQCDRRGCDNIMCDRYSHTHGRICSSCFAELVALGTAVDVEQFMAREPIETEAAEAYWNVFFPEG